MTINGLGAPGNVQQVQAGAGNAGAAPAAGAEAGGLPPEALVEAKIGLDQREEAWRGIVGTGGVGDKGEAPAFADKRIADMNEQELRQLFGDRADKMKELGQRQPDLTGTQVWPLRGDEDSLDSIHKLLERRTDLNWNDLVKVGADGKTRVDPSVTDGPSGELLQMREDVKPIDLTRMAASFHEELRDPGLAEAARKKAMTMLRERPDVKPQELTTLMQTLVRGQNGNAGASGAAALDMFDSSARLLTTRRDLNAQDATRLAGSVLGMAGKKDSQSGLRSANAFSEAVDTLSTRQDMGVEGIVQLTQVMNQRFPGQDESSAADRHAGFSKGLSLMRQVPGMDAATIGNMMQKASDGPPPRQGIRLLNAFDTMSQGLVDGRANRELVADPLARPDPKGNQKRDGEIVLDKYGNEKAAEDRPVLPEHRAAHGSDQTPERPPQGEGRADGKPSEGPPVGGPGEGPAGAPPEPGTPDAADPGGNPQEPRRQPGQ